jgi:hypothetical protein
VGQPEGVRVSDIKLVKNDNRPLITLTLKDETTGVVLNLVGATVVVYFRKKGTTAVLSTLSCSFVTDGTDGKVSFKFPGTALNVDPGQYEGEIEITYSGGDKQTVYDTLQFKVRDQFQ